MVVQAQILWLAVSFNFFKRIFLDNFLDLWFRLLIATLLPVFHYLVHFPLCFSFFISRYIFWGTRFTAFNFWFEGLDCAGALLIFSIFVFFFITHTDVHVGQSKLLEQIVEWIIAFEEWELELFLALFLISILVKYGIRRSSLFLIPWGFEPEFLFLFRVKSTLGLVVSHESTWWQFLLGVVVWQRLALSIAQWISFVPMC